MNFEIVWVLVSSGFQVQSQIILDLDYLSDYLSVSYDCEKSVSKIQFLKCNYKVG